jgi:hypothetical protein
MAGTNVYTGAYGSLVIGNSNDTAEGRDGIAIQDAYDLHEVGRVVDVTLRVDTHLEEFHEVGRRHPVSLHSGNVHISGTVGRAYVNGALLYMLLGRGALPTQAKEPYVQPRMNMVLRLSDPAVPGTTAEISLFTVKFENWALTLPEDDFVLENVRFKALALNVLDEEAPAGGGQPTQVTPQFPEAATQ